MHLLPVDGERDVLVGDEYQLLHGDLLQLVDVRVMEQADCSGRVYSTSGFSITYQPGYWRAERLFISNIIGYNGFNVVFVQCTVELRRCKKKIRIDTTAYKLHAYIRDPPRLDQFFFRCVI